MEDKIILIGGAPTAGKTFLAKKLSKEMDIPWISTDTIRKFMRKLVYKKDYPNLFYFTNKRPEIYLPNHTPRQIVRDQNKESIDVWKGIKGFIESNRNWSSYIIEGVAILPHLVFRDFKNSKLIKAIFILNKDKEKLSEIIFKRGLWTSATKYSDELKTKEVEWVMLFNFWLEKELKKYRYPAVEFKDGHISISKVKKYL